MSQRKISLLESFKLYFSFKRIRNWTRYHFIPLCKRRNMNASSMNCKLPLQVSWTHIRGALYIFSGGGGSSVWCHSLTKQHISSFLWSRKSNINFWEWWDSNPGQLLDKRDPYLCAILSTQLKLDLNNVGSSYSDLFFLKHLFLFTFYS